MMTVTLSGRPAVSHPPASLASSVRIQAGLALLTLAASASIAFALPPEEERGSDLTVGPATICRDVQDRTPIEAGESFPPDVGRLYCFTRINGAVEPTHATHVWFHENREIDRIEVNVGGPTWRTWSYKTIPPGWIGAWRVDIEDADGVIIYSLPFTITEEAPGEESAPDTSGR